MADKYDTMTPEEVHRLAVERIVAGTVRPKDYAYDPKNSSDDAMSCILALGDHRWPGLYKSGCTITAYPHDDCYSCEFYIVKSGYENKQGFGGEDVAGSDSCQLDPHGGLEGSIFRAALRAIDYGAANPER